MLITVTFTHESLQEPLIVPVTLIDGYLESDFITIQIENEYYEAFQLGIDVHGVRISVWDRTFEMVESVYLPDFPRSHATFCLQQRFRLHSNHYAPLSDTHDE